MKQSLKWLVGLILVFAISLGFATTNNLGIQFTSFGEPEYISNEEIVKVIKQDVEEPLFEALYKKDPHRHMSKCYSILYSSIHGVELAALVDSDVKIYKGQAIYGKVTHNNCGNKEDVCSFQYDLETKAVMIKESYFTEWVTLEQFIQRLDKIDTKNQLGF